MLDAPEILQDASRSVKQLWVGEWQATKSIAMDEPVTASCLLGIFMGRTPCWGRVKNGQVKTKPSEVVIWSEWQKRFCRHHCWQHRNFFRFHEPFLNHLYIYILSQFHFHNIQGYLEEELLQRNLAERKWWNVQTHEPIPWVEWMVLPFHGLKMMDTNLMPIFVKISVEFMVSWLQWLRTCIRTWPRLVSQDGVRLCLRFLLTRAKVWLGSMAKVSTRWYW